jgi:hypothetical protein
MKGTNVVNNSLGSNNRARSQHLRVNSPDNLIFPALSVSHKTPRNTDKNTSTCLLLPPRFSPEPPRNEMNQPTAFLGHGKIEREAAIGNPYKNESMCLSTKTTPDFVYVFNDASDDSGDEGDWILCEPSKDLFESAEKVTFSSSCGVDEIHILFVKTGCFPNITATAGEPANTNALTPISGILVDDNSQTCSVDDMDLCCFMPNLRLSGTAYSVDGTTIGLSLNSKHTCSGVSAISSRDLITPPPIRSTNTSEPPTLKQPIRIPWA